MSLHCGDCLEVMRGMPAGSVDLVVTSPPYNLLNTDGGGFSPSSVKNSKWGASDFHFGGYENHDDAMPQGEYVSWQRECLAAMWDLLSDAGAIFYNHKYRIQDGVLVDHHNIIDGFAVRQVIIWHRAGGFNFNPHYYLPTYEVIYLIAKPDFRLLPKKNAVGDVWNIRQEQDNPHPASFPVALPTRCIASTNARVILDPFMGSGTTAIAAIRSGREWIGIEKSAKYCKMAEERIAVEQRRLSLFAMEASE